MYYKVRFSIGQIVILPHYIFYGVICNFSVSFWSLQFFYSTGQNGHLQDHDVVKTQVKNPIHAVANVDDYSGSARLLAATTLRSSSFLLSLSLSSLLLHHHFGYPRSSHIHNHVRLSRWKSNEEWNWWCQYFHNRCNRLLYVDSVYLFFQLLPIKSEKSDSDSTTGWSKETVDCKFLLTDPEFSRSVITRWFLESLYREVLVFCCFKNARCVEFCLSKIFQYKASCTKQGLNTQMLPRSNPNLKQVHKQHTDTLSEAPQTPSSNLQTP